MGASSCELVAMSQELAPMGRLCLDFLVGFEVRAECGMPLGVGAVEHV